MLTVPDLLEFFCGYFQLLRHLFSTLVGYFTPLAANSCNNNFPTGDKSRYGLMHPIPHQRIANTTIGTVIFETQPPGTITVTSYGNYPGTTTLTVVPYSGSFSGTEVIGVPLTTTTTTSSSTFNYLVTSSRPYSGTSPLSQPTTVTTIPAQGDAPGMYQLPPLWQRSANLFAKQVQ
jgi:hypothetical protein